MDPNASAVFQNGPEKPGDRTEGSFENAGTLTIGFGCIFKNSGSFTNKGTCTNGGTFNHNGTGSNEKDFTNNGTFVCTAEFTNSGTFVNEESAACNIDGQTGKFNNDGTFVNKNTGFAPVTNFYTEGTYQENNLRTGLHIMETDSDNKVLQFKPLSAVGSCWTNWTSGTTVTLYGSSTSSSPYDLSTGDAVNFRSIGKTVTVTLDLNGQHLDMKNEYIKVAGTLTICDSSEAHNGSIIASKPNGKNPPVQVAEGGTCTVEQDSIIIEPEMPDRGSATEGEQGTEQENEQGSEQNPEQGNGQDPAQEP